MTIISLDQRRKALAEIETAVLVLLRDHVELSALDVIVKSGYSTNAVLAALDALRERGEAECSRDKSPAPMARRVLEVWNAPYTITTELPPRLR